MKTISITLASPELAELVERALRFAVATGNPFVGEGKAVMGVADALREAVDRISPRGACARCGSPDHPVCF